MKLIKRVALILLICWLPGTAFGEAIGKDDQEVRAVAEPLLDTQLEGISKDNYDLYVKNYDSPLQLLFDKEKFSKMREQVASKLGKYKSRSYLGFLKKGNDTQILWKGNFDKTDDDMLIRLVVSRKDGKNRIKGLYFQ
jgi:hypothetical protein